MTFKPPPAHKPRQCWWENENDIPDVPQPISLSFCYWSVCYGLGSIFMNWNSLTKMVLWCFNVTVPDPVLLRCYQGSETTTNQKQGGLQSLLASPPLFWCCLLRPLLTACYNLLWAVFLFGFFVLPLVAKHRKASRKGKLAPWLRMGVGLSGLAGAPFYICPLKPNEKRRVKSYFFYFFIFWGRGVRFPCLFSHGRHSHSQGHMFSCSPGCQVDVS